MTHILEWKVPGALYDRRHILCAVRTPWKRLPPLTDIDVMIASQAEQRAVHENADHEEMGYAPVGMKRAGSLEELFE